MNWSETLAETGVEMNGGENVAQEIDVMVTDDLLYVEIVAREIGEMLNSHFYPD